VSLHGERHGDLVDFFGGRKDLHGREIRVLHSLSFIDDPTRAIRAVRYARRLEFAIATDTRNLIGTAVGEGVFDRLSGQRLRRELEILLDEDHPAPAIGLLAELGLLPAICEGLEWSEDIRTFLLELEGQLAWYELEQLGPSPAPWLLFLGGVALESGAGIPKRLADRLQLAGDQQRRLLDLPGGVARIREASTPGRTRSSRVRAVEDCSPEVVLVAMAGVDLERRRLLASAVEAAVRVVPAATGRQLVDAGVEPGPWIGEALKLTRDAIVDHEIGAVDSRDFAVECARRLQREASV
jgi:tRNA nucleotidyltransferase (CCA-adding enzyme)